MEDFIKDELSQISNKIEINDNQSTDDKSQMHRNLESFDKINKKIKEVKREYDSQYKPNKQDIAKFPDLQNGPSSLIQGSNVEIQQVGIHNFRLPLKYRTRDNGVIELETKVTGTVSLEAS